MRLPTAEAMLSSLGEIVQARQQLNGALGGFRFDSDPLWRSLRDSAERIETRADEALNDFEPLLANAYRVERLVGLVAGACSRWSAGESAGTRTAGRTVTIRVEPRPDPETARLADRAARTFTVEVQPRTLLRPALGLTAVAAPDARFARYATRPVSGGVQIYESGRSDSRFGVGGSLAFTWPGLDQRDERGVALWLPELVVTAGRVSAFGIGPAISWSYVKLGAGALWIRHDALDGVRAGDVVADESGLVLSERYGPPRLYVSLSVFDWAPFAGRLRRD